MENQIISTLTPSKKRRTPCCWLQSWRRTPTGIGAELYAEGTLLRFFCGGEVELSFTAYLQYSKPVVVGGYAKHPRTPKQANEAAEWTVTYAKIMEMACGWVFAHGWSE